MLSLHSFPSFFPPPGNGNIAILCVLILAFVAFRLRYAPILRKISTFQCPSTTHDPRHATCFETRPKHPPVVGIPVSRNLLCCRMKLISRQSHEMFTRPREAYESALKAHGPVIGVMRKGRVSLLHRFSYLCSNIPHPQLEYIVDEDHTMHVLSNDKDFSFEVGVAAVCISMNYLLRRSES